MFSLVLAALSANHQESSLHDIFFHDALAQLDNFVSVCGGYDVEYSGRTFDAKLNWNHSYQTRISPLLPCFFDPHILHIRAHSELQLQITNKVFLKS